MKHSTLVDKIYKAGVYFLRPLNLKKTYEGILSEFKGLTNAKYATIYIFNKGDLQKVSSDSPIGIVPRKKGAAYTSYKEGKIIVLNHKYLLAHHPAVAQKVRSVVLVPLQNRSRPFGVLSLEFTKGALHIQRKTAALKLYGSIAALAIRKAQLHEDIKRALEDRDLFISMASHELKTPLTVISLNSQLIARSIKKERIPDLAWTESISDQINRITRLINEFLQVKAIKKGELILVLKNCGLEDIVRQAVSDVGSRYPKHSIMFTSNLSKQSDVIRADHDKLVQVIINLLTNAAKFSPPEKSISVTLEKRQRLFTIVVKDGGIGIAKSELPRIFDKYYQSRVRSQGMGIGLYLSKHIIEGHKGEIKVRSIPNRGTEFKIILPHIPYLKPVQTHEMTVFNQAARVA